MRTLVVVSALCTFVAAPAVAHAQQSSPAPRFEVSGSFALNGPRQDGVYTTAYTPPFRFVTYTGSAGQALTLDTGRVAGFAVAAAYFPHSRLGVQVIVNRLESDLAGENTPYGVSVQYVALYPPDYMPREVLYERDTAWPDTVGSMSNLSISANAAVRLVDGPVGVQVSGGPSIFRTRGSMQRLGYTELWLGGHSVLFLSEPEVALAIEPKTTLGFNAGGEVAVSMSRLVALAIDARYFYAPTSSSDVRVTRILNLDELIDADSIDVIQTQMDLQPVEFDASFFRLAMGVKFSW